MGLFIQKEEITYSGSAMESAITLTRPEVAGTSGRWDIKEIRLTATSAGAGAYVQVLRKSAASTANERDDAHADSKGVLLAEGYLSNGDIVFDFNDASTIGERNLSSTPLRLYLSLGAEAMAVYANIKYVYSG